MKDKIQTLVNTARKERDDLARIALQTVLATVQELENRDNKILSEDDILVVIKKERNKYVEAADTVEGEQKENYEKQANVLDNLLPKALDDDQYEGVAQDYINELNAQTMRDMGKVLSQIKKDFGIRVDMSKMSPIVKEKLT